MKSYHFSYSWSYSTNRVGLQFQNIRKLFFFLRKAEAPDWEEQGEAATGEAGKPGEAGSGDRGSKGVAQLGEEQDRAMEGLGTFPAEVPVWELCSGVGRWGGVGRAG